MFHIFSFKENETGKKRKISISEHVVITPKLSKTVDISKCVICQVKTKEKLVEVPGNIEKLLSCIKERESYENLKYREIQNQINTLNENELNNLSYHRSCYCETTNKSKINRDKSLFEKTTSNASCSPTLCINA